jgi:hypothetical protein
MIRITSMQVCKRWHWLNLCICWLSVARLLCHRNLIGRSVTVSGASAILEGLGRFPIQFMLLVRMMDGLWISRLLRQSVCSWWMCCVKNWTLSDGSNVLMDGSDSVWVLSVAFISVPCYADGPSVSSTDTPPVSVQYWLSLPWVIRLLQYCRCLSLVLVSLSICYRWTWPLVLMSVLALLSQNLLIMMAHIYLSLS